MLGVKRKAAEATIIRMPKTAENSVRNVTLRITDLRVTPSIKMISIIGFSSA